MRLRFRRRKPTVAEQIRRQTIADLNSPDPWDDVYARMYARMMAPDTEAGR
jgi:hypothetical protein